MGDSSPAGDYFSLRGEKERGGVSLATGMHCVYRLISGTIPYRDKLGMPVWTVLGYIHYSWPFYNHDTRTKPHSLSLSKFRSGPSEETKSFRPRQFEYHPTDPRLMVFGTLDGELVVINHESEKLVGYLPSVGTTLNSILGLCWLKKHPSKVS
ncbi:hypothetical protein B296_00033981 [Ensete ventricosum]|uniref:Uncharacterized protein n=1 Tax=Ensete ventricosum TaxID=4639 RepID=A0A427A4P9_ENSVE|nr:hypothetical protein B296_00033981 [Ensete ventricosum]